MGASPGADLHLVTTPAASAVHRTRVGWGAAPGRGAAARSAASRTAGSAGTAWPTPAARWSPSPPRRSAGPPPARRGRARRARSGP